MNNVVIVTGGSSGIGLSIVKRFIADGNTVINLDIMPSQQGHYINCDMRNLEQVSSAIETVVTQYPRVDSLVCNAGIHISGTIENTSEQALDNIFALNVKGAFAAVKSCLPVMKKANNGSIVFVASDQALIGKQNSFAYNLSKHALASMAKTTALDYAEYNIRANAVCPGTIETPLYHKAINTYCEKSGADKAKIHAEEAALQPLNRLGQPEEVAELVYFLCSDKASFITGSLQSIDGGYTTG